MAKPLMAPTVLVAGLSCWVLLAVLLLLNKEARSSIPYYFGGVTQGRLLWVRGELRAEPDDVPGLDGGSGGVNGNDTNPENSRRTDADARSDRPSESRDYYRRPDARYGRVIEWSQILKGEDDNASDSMFDYTFHQPIPDDVRQVFLFAGRVVSAYFTNVRVPMRVLVEWMPLERDVLAHAGPTAFYKVSSTRHGLVWLPKALMNQRVKFPPPDYDQPDMVLTVNSIGNWHLGLDGAVPRGKYDLLTVVIHELQHGLGFLSMIGQGNTLNGIQKFQAASEGESYVFDRYVHIVEQGHIFSVSTDYHSISNEVDLVWESSSFTRENRPKLYMPEKFDGTSSISHLDEAAYPPGAPSSLMTPILGKQESIHSLGGLVVKMYEDMGWQMRDCTQYKSCGSCVSKLCRWCFDATTGEGECGDPTSHPFFNSECRRPNITFVANEFCSLPGGSRPGQAPPEPQQRLSSSSPPPSSPSNEPYAEEREFDVVVAKATNECGDVVKCNDTHTPSALHALGLTIFCLGIVFLIIYL